MPGKKRFFAKHAKSSAALVSLGIHAVLIIIAFSFVAVTVINKADQAFEAKPVNRPRMQLKKLQVPINIKKKRLQQPKLRQRIVVKPRLNQNVPDIKMPEISGIKGGLGSGTGGLGAAGGVGFSMPEIEIFGVKSKGEKVFIALDSSFYMMIDERGGIPAYTLIKAELVRIIDGLPPTALFNIAVFDNNRTFVLFPQMVTATPANVEKVDKWLKPLNSVNPQMRAEDWGPQTLGPGGTQVDEDLSSGDFRRTELWHRAALLAMKQQADTVFVLSSWWGFQRYAAEERDLAWYETAEGERYLKKYEQALQLYDEDNKRRLAKGEAPRALNRNDKRLMVVTYFPDYRPLPPEPEFYYHKPEEYIENMMEIRKQYRPTQTEDLGGIQRKKKIDFTFNVVRFVPVGEENPWQNSRSVQNFKKMTQLLKGDYRELKGLEAIKSSVSAADAE